jgi:outer membrane protein OmpA-like peptidoglycan-associated protein
MDMKRILPVIIGVAYPFFSIAQQSDTIVVHFRFGKYVLDESEKHKIDSAMRRKNISYIEINAHTDAIGSDKYNQVLSDQRGMEVTKYITASRKVDSISQRASGEMQPLNDNATAAKRALNRRAEIVIHTRLLVADAKYTPDTAAGKAEAEALEASKMATPAAKEDTDKYGQKMFAADKIESSKEGTTLVLPNMNFYGGRHKMYPEGEKTLESLLQAMRDYPKLEIQIQGHVCCEYNGQDGYDFDAGDRKLSVNRARMVYDYLIRNGIEASRLSYKGFGSKHKITLERDEYEQMLNRRVEIKIIKK